MPTFLPSLVFSNIKQQLVPSCKALMVMHNNDDDDDGDGGDDVDDGDGVLLQRKYCASVS